MNKGEISMMKNEEELNQEIIYLTIDTHQFNFDPANKGMNWNSKALTKKAAIKIHGSALGEYKEEESERKLLDTIEKLKQERKDLENKLKNIQTSLNDSKQDTEILTKKYTRLCLATEEAKKVRENIEKLSKNAD